jgi:hypothetical protein
MTNARHLIALLLLVFTSCEAFAQTFYPLFPSACPSSSAGLFTTGGQYLDPNNGVLQDKWSMLIRWQGSIASNSAFYNVGTYTGLTVPTPYSSWQRGYQPENQSAETPAVQLHCFDSGMVLNSFDAPHTGVVGGGWNDMYGYAWSSANRPAAFQYLSTVGCGGLPVCWKPAELVLQAYVAVPQTTVWTLNGGSWVQFTDRNHWYNAGTGQVSLFAYIRDASNPSLHPIGMLAGVYGWGPDVPPCPSPATGGLGWDYADGAWFSSNGFCTSDTATVRYTQATSQAVPFAQGFFRMHYTPQNLTNLINRINGLQCTAGQSNSCNCQPGVSCPQTGYSSNPNNYVVEYFGVLGETIACENAACSTSFTDRQVQMAVQASSVGAWSYH